MDAPPVAARAFEAVDDELSDAEIAAAFADLDVRKRGVIGVDDLRHVLMCMGELVTDDEVLAMLQLAAGNRGITDISLAQLTAVARDLHLDDTFRSHAGAAVGSPIATPLTPPVAAPDRAPPAAEKARVLARARALRNMMRGHSLRFAHLVRALHTAQGMREFQRAHAFMGATSVAQALGLPRPDELVHAAIQALAVDAPTAGDATASTAAGAARAVIVDLRTLLLALSVVTDASEDQKLHFAFDLYDTDGSGTLELDELLNVLGASHLLPPEHMRPRATLLLEQARAVGLLTSSTNEPSLPPAASTSSATATTVAPSVASDVQLTLTEFKAIVARFPRAVFPALPRDNDGTVALVAQTQ